MDKEQQEVDRWVKRFNFWWGAFWVAFALAVTWFTAPDIDTFYDRIKYGALAGIGVYMAMEYLDRRFKRIEDKVDTLTRNS